MSSGGPYANFPKPRRPPTRLWVKFAFKLGADPALGFWAEFFPRKSEQGLSNIVRRLLEIFSTTSEAWRMRYVGYDCWWQEASDFGQ